MHDDTSDISLLNAWQGRRDAEAFHTIVSRHARLVYNTCRHILRNDADAADVSQECFLCLASTPPEINYSLSGWLHRLATHRSLDHLKAAKRRRDREVRYARDAVVANQVEQADLLAMVDEAIDALPDDLRVPLIDHFLGQKSHQEVADVLGIPRRTVTYRINSGVERLRKQLSRKGVLIPAAGLGAVLEAHAGGVPAPDGLCAALAKVAMAGRVPMQAATPTPAMLVTLKSMGLWAVIAIVAGCTWWLFGGHSEPTSPRAAESGEAHSSGTVDAPLGNGVASPGGASVGTPSKALSTADATAVLAGRVYDTATQAGLPGVEISATFSEDSRSALTDESGEYRIERLPAAIAQVTVGAVEGYYAKDKPVQRVALALSPVAVLDFGMKPGQFSGVSGIVRDENGEPVADALVTAWSEEHNGGVGQKQESRSGEDGSFEIVGLEIDASLFLQGTTDASASAPLGPLRLGNEDLAGQDLTLFPVASVSGTVVDLEGKPVGAGYWAYSYSKNAAKMHSASELGPESEFRIGDLAPGTYDLFVESKNSRSWGDLRPAATVVLAPGEKKVDVTLVTGYPQQIASIELSGGLQFQKEPKSLGTIQGVVRDADTGEPIQAYSLAVAMYDLGVSNEMREIANEQGAYSIAVRESRSIVVTASAPGHERETATLYPQDLTPPVTTVDFSLHSGAIVEGTVLNNSGSPVAGARILINNTPEELMFTDWSNAKDSVLTDAEGRFTLNTLREEPIRIYVAHPKYAYAWLDLTPTHKASTTPSITLTEGATITGAVYDGRTPIPNKEILAFNVESRDLGYFRATTDQSGQFRMDYLSPGRYEVYTSSNEDKSVGGGGMGLTMVKQQITLSDGETGEVTLRFVEGNARISGLITINGSPSESSVRVEISPQEQGADAAITVEGRDGSYQRADLPEGLTSLQFMITDPSGVQYLRKRSVVLVPFLETVENLDIVGAPVSVHVTGMEDEQHVDLFVYEGDITTEDLSGSEPSEHLDQMSAFTTLDSDGAASLSAIPAGRYTIYAEVYEYPQGKRRVLNSTIYPLMVNSEGENRVDLAF